MELFEFIDGVFGSEEEYSKISSFDKDKYFFIFNRMMGIKFPKQANHFNHQNINKSDIVDFWRLFILKNVSKSKPSFLYTKAKKAEVKEYWEPDDKVMYKKYLEWYGYTRKDFQDASIIDLKNTKESFKKFKEMFN